MCGICGISAGRHQPELASIVARMNDALVHRGPDDSGQYTNESCSLAMRRLSIIDIQTGQQPITNEDDTLVILFNGEIYNFQELRRGLERSCRHRFKTNTDTEVILHLYEEEGFNTPQRLKGMFAFCIYDVVRNQLFIARDRFGEKPLYYAIVDGHFGFSSELKSLLQWPLISRRVDREALFYHLHLGYVPSEMTLFEGVRQLPAGNALLWDQRQMHIEPYYEPVYRVDKILDDEEVAKEALRATLLEATSSQMTSDVPLGAFLSGGLDSSSVVAAMQQQSSEPIKTFNVRFEQAQYDESAVARETAKLLGTEHHEFVITDASFNTDDVLRIVDHAGQPFLDSSAIPTYYVCKSLRDHVTVALSGDGGDEMFGGYHFYPRSLAVDRLAEVVPRPGLAIAQNAFSQMASVPGLKRFGGLRRIRRATEVARLDAALRPGAIEELFTRSELSQAHDLGLKTQWRTMQDEFTPRLMHKVGDISRLRQLLYYRVKYSLVEDMLTKVDRMSMANALEVRAPLLSAEVSDFAMTLPDHYILNNGIKKYLLREAVRPWLPEAVYTMPKSGFAIPLHQFQNEAYESMCREYVANAQRDGLVARLFSPESRRQIFERGLAQKSDGAGYSVYRASHQLWLLLQFGLWAERFDVNL